MADTARAQVPRITVPVHGLTRYLRSRLEVVDGVLAWEVPRALLGLIPIGTRRIEVPLEEVRSLQIEKALSPVRLLTGAALVVVPLALGLGWAAIPLVAVGALVMAVSFGLYLEVVTLGGGRHRAEFCFGHRIDAELYTEAVRDLRAAATN